MKRLVTAAATGAAALALAAPAQAQQVTPVCNETTNAGNVERLTVCAEANTAANLAQVSVVWCLNWSFGCQTSVVAVPKPILTND